MFSTNMSHMFSHKILFVHIYVSDIYLSYIYTVCKMHVRALQNGKNCVARKKLKKRVAKNICFCLSVTPFYTLIIS